MRQSEGASWSTRSLYLFDSRSQKASYEKLESLEFRLYDYQLEIGLWIHVARLVLDELNLAATLALCTVVLSLSVTK
jgi:hypothetical protein